MKFLQEINSNGYVTLPVNISEDLCNEVIQAYRTFDKNTSVKDKETTTYAINPGSKIEFGYENRLKEEGFDNKSYFHFNPNLLNKEFLKENLKYKLFLEKAHTLYLKIQEEVKKTLIKISEETQVELNELFNLEGTPSLNMRIVNYKPTKRCKKLAKKHVDWCIMTFAIYETETGLNFYHNNKTTPISYNEKQMKLFPSKGWNKYIQTPFEALEHEVINTGKNKERSAIVIFVNPKIN
jgi:hypothetical protein